jgi:hypothetical protein
VPGRSAQSPGALQHESVVREQRAENWINTEVCELCAILKHDCIKCADLPDRAKLLWGD